MAGLGRAAFAGAPGESIEDAPAPLAHLEGPEARDNAECSICLQALGKKPFVLDCGHKFHRVCICRWLNSPMEHRRSRGAHCSCPMCRAPMSAAKEATLEAGELEAPRARVPGVVVYCALPRAAALLQDARSTLQRLWSRRH